MTLVKLIKFLVKIMHDLERNFHTTLYVLIKTVIFLPALYTIVFCNTGFALVGGAIPRFM